MAKASGEANAEHPTSNVQRRSQRRSALGVRRLLDFVPNRIQLDQLHFAQFPAARFEFVL